MTVDSSNISEALSLYFFETASRCQAIKIDEAWEVGQCGGHFGGVRVVCTVCSTDWTALWTHEDVIGNGI